MAIPDTTQTGPAGAGRDAAAREYLGKLLERHRVGSSENDIRSAFRDFLVRTGIADDESEIVTRPQHSKPDGMIVPEIGQQATSHKPTQFTGTMRQAKGNYGDEQV